MNEIKNIDMFKYIKELKNRNVIVDFILTDPPYNISKKNNFKTMGRSGIDFGDWDKDFNQERWIKEIIPLLKSGGNIIIFNDWKNMGIITDALELAGCKRKALLRWIKANPIPANVERRYVTDFEFAIWAVKGNGKWTFNKPTTAAYLKPEFKAPIVLSKNERIHPTQKPVKILKEMIEIHSNEGDIVFDPFIGSGSTIVAAIESNRNFIGCEIDEEYFNKAKARIDEAKRKNITIFNYDKK